MADDNPQLDEAITWKVFQDEELTTFATAIVATYNMLSQVDKLNACTRRLCGEIHMPGFEHWRNEFDERQLASRV